MVFCKYSPLGSSADDLIRMDRLARSELIDPAIPGNWILTATGVPVLASTALCTCPIEAEATGVRSKEENSDCHSDPSSSDMTL
jgi:hypothetical protein